MLAPSESELSFGWQCFRDVSASAGDNVVLRSDIASEEHASEWVRRYSDATNTSWIVYKTHKEGRCERMVCHKVWRCHLNDHNKVTKRRNTGCMAFIDIKVKKVNYNTKKNDAFLRRDPPLCAVMKLCLQHNHATESAAAPRLQRCSDATKALFQSYFSDGLTPAEAIRLHESTLAVEEDAASLVQLASGAINPTKRTVYHLYEKWQHDHYGSVGDPFTKLNEKIPGYAALGADVMVNKEAGTDNWAILLATPIMKRAQLLESSSEIIFVDSTASCDTTRSTVTVMLTATAAGAVPICALLHNNQTTEGYAAAFKLLKCNYPFCFGGREVSFRIHA